MSFILKRAISTDAGDLSCFAARSFCDTYKKDMDEGDLKAYLADAFSPTIQAAEISDPATTVIVARSESDPDRRIIGYLQLTVRGTYIELKRLYIDEMQKGRGLAILLVEEAQNECRRLALTKLRLTVWTRNPRAIAFYRKMGFAVIGSEIFMAGEDAQIDHVMEMAVPPESASPRETQLGQQRGDNMLSYQKGIRQVSEDFFAFMVPHGDWGQTNAGIVVSGTEIVLIDTFWDLGSTREMLDEIRSHFPDKRIKTVINTHHDGDHWWGNQLLDPDVEIVASQKFMEFMSSPEGKKPEEVVALKHRFQGCCSPTGNYVDYAFGRYDFSDVQLRFPQKAFSGGMRLEHGDKTLILRDDLGNAHSGSDSVVFSPKGRVLYTGDLVFFGAHVVMWIGPLSSWVQSVKKILDFDADVFVPGHGPILQRDSVKQYLRYLEALMRHASEQIARGRSYVEAAESFEDETSQGWIGPERLIATFSTEYRVRGLIRDVDLEEVFRLMGELRDKRLAAEVGTIVAGFDASTGASRPQ